MTYIFNLLLAVSAATPFSIYQSKGGHQIIVARDEAGAPAAVYFKYREDLHRRHEAKLLPPLEEGFYAVSVGSDLERYVVIPPRASDFSLYVAFDAINAVEYEPKSLDLLTDEDLGRLERENCRFDLRAAPVTASEDLSNI